jgi:hypothetical protein
MSMQSGAERPQICYNSKQVASEASNNIFRGEAAMTSQFEPFFRLQLAAWEGWARLMINNYTAFEKLVESQHKLFCQHSYLRHQNIIPCGASWFDHYGKRNHDVDVEKV